MSSSNCCFLTCIQISQEACQVVWYSHLFKNFPQFVVICIVKGFSVVSEAEIDVFLEVSCFFDDPTGVGNLISGCSAFSKSSLNIWKFTVHILHSWSLAWRILSITFACVWDKVYLYLFKIKWLFYYYDVLICVQPYFFLKTTIPNTDIAISALLCCFPHIFFHPLIHVFLYLYLKVQCLYVAFYWMFSYNYLHNF